MAGPPPTTTVIGSNIIADVAQYYDEWHLNSIIKTSITADGTSGIADAQGARRTDGQP